MTLPWLEVLVGICLVGGVFVSGALLVSAGMAAMFTFVLDSVIYHGLSITCGCFGAGSTDIIGISTLIRAALIGMFSILGYVWIILSNCHIRPSRYFRPSHRGINRVLEPKTHIIMQAAAIQAT
jgi:hypothetical protein